MEVVLVNHAEMESIERVNGDLFADRLLQSDLLVSQLRAAVQERESLLQQKETQLQEEAKTHEAKMSKVKLQARAKLSARMENSRRLKSSDSSDEAECRASDQGSVKRGKLLLLRHRVAELEAALAKEKQKQQQQQDEQGSKASGAVQELQHQVQALQEALCEKDELIQGRMCIIELLQDQLGEMSAAVGSEGDPLGLRQSNNQLRQKVLALETALQHREERHQQEVFTLTARNDATEDFQQLLKSLKQNLHEKEEVLAARTHVVEILQAELDQRDATIVDLQESGRRALEQQRISLSHQEAKKLMLTACLQNSIDQQIQPNDSCDRHPASGEGVVDTELLQPCPPSLEQEALLQRIQELEVGLREREEEAAKSEARFLQTKAWSKTRIRQLEDELRSLRSGSAVELPSLRSRVSELEEELSRYTHVHAHNEELASRLHVFEQLERVMQLDLEQAVLHNSAKDGEKDVHRVISQDSVVSGTMEEREGLIEDDWLFPGYSEHPSFVGGASGAGKGQAPRSLLRAEDEPGGQLANDGRLAATREARSLQSKKASPLGEGESLADLWDDYSVDHAVSIPSQGHVPSPEYPLMCDTSAVRGLRSVVGDLELERNQLQQQIQELEEQLEEMDTRQSLQVRTNGLQAEVERLKSQLSQLQNEKSQDEESHHSAMSNLCDRISVLVEENARLEGALQEKERALNSQSAHAARFQATEASLAEAVTALSTLSAKLSTAEMQLQEAAVKRSASEAECSELRVAIDDCNKQLALKTTKLQLLEEQENSARAESEHLAEELERLNLSFMEERAHLIATLQEREREADRLQEAEAEAFTCQGDVTEPSERIDRFPESRPLAHTRHSQAKRLLWDETSAGLERQLGEAREMLAAAVEEASKVKAEGIRLEGKVTVEVERGRKTYEQLQKTSATLQEKEREIVTMQTEYLAKEREISMLKTECAFKEQDIGILKAKHQDKEEEIVMMHMKHQDMEQEIMMLRLKWEENERMIASRDVEHLDMEREIVKLKTEHRTKEQELAMLKAEREDKEREIVAMHAKHRDSERVIAMINAEGQNTELKIAVLKAQGEDQKREIATLNVQLQNTEREMASLKQEIVTLSTRHQDKEREIATLNTQRQDKEQDIAKLHLEWRHREQEIKMLNVKCQDRDREIATLHALHQEKDRKMSTLLLNAEISAAALAQKDTELRELTDTASLQRKAALARASQLQSRLAATESMIRDQEAQVSSSLTTAERRREEAERAELRAALARQAEDGDGERAALGAQVQGLQRNLQEAQGRYEQLRVHALALQQQLALLANRPCSQGESQYEDVGPPGAPRHKPSLPSEPSPGLHRLGEARTAGVFGLPSADHQHTVVVDWEGGDADDGADCIGERGQWGDEAESLVYDPRHHPLTRQVRRLGFCVRHWLRGRARYCSAHAHSRKSFVAALYLLAMHLLLVYLLVW
ncbi:myosin-11-like isoform X2 [Lethenteron reissneri]|uniref:myosin-11-like isoform X2 n=1 Tax=Lethenteron reissneri TaxID=7753 RepID=UPI002AB71292|nr:myosin-11-like isoform X2 [Lethenteron reissneri]